MCSNFLNVALFKVSMRSETVKGAQGSAPTHMQAHLGTASTSTSLYSPASRDTYQGIDLLQHQGSAHLRAEARQHLFQRQLSEAVSRDQEHIQEHSTKLGTGPVCSTAYVVVLNS